MPLIGLLTSRIDNRWLIAFGFGLFAICSIWFSRLDLAISQWSLLWAVILSGFAAGCVFVPLSTTAMASLRNEEIGNASGLYNLLRNIGGSVGISVVNTVVTRHEQVHRAYLVHSFEPGNGLLQQQLEGLQSMLHESIGVGADLATQSQQALGVLNGFLSQQAALLSYVDVFRDLAIVCSLCVPLVFVLRKAVRRKGAVSTAH
jgi:DHA2 family multidrug resistance protein